MRWRKYGDPLFITRAENGAPQAWLRTVLSDWNRENGCWTWPFGQTDLGYGSLVYQGKSAKAHAVALLLDGQPQPKPPENYALHNCDNPLCVNPNHLRWGSQKDNVSDIFLRGRWQTGYSHHWAKLDAAAVRVIRNTNQTDKELAQRYGVHLRTIQRARSGVNWKHV